MPKLKVESVRMLAKFLGILLMAGSVYSAWGLLWSPWSSGHNAAPLGDQMPKVELPGPPEAGPGLSPRDKDAYLTQLRAEPDFDSLFFRVDIEEEYRRSVNGTPFHPLPNYENPCWMSRSIDLTQKNHSVRLRCMPRAMLIGVSKCGTTDLFTRLTRHPDVIRPRQKEVRFWNRLRIGTLKFGSRRVAGDAPSSPQRMNFKSNLNAYDMAADQIESRVVSRDGVAFHPSITMEGTPHYLWDYDGWGDIPANKGLMEPRLVLPHTLHRLYPKLKMIVLLRNPTDRLFSQYRMLTRDGSSEVFHEMALQSVARWNVCARTYGTRSCAYNSSANPWEYTTPGGMTLRAGLYSVFLRDWLAVFPKEQFLILRAEDYYENTLDTLRIAYNFLGVSDPRDNPDLDWLLTEGNAANTMTGRGRRLDPMLDTSRRLLDDFYRPFNRDLADILADVAFEWHDVS